MDLLQCPRCESRFYVPGDGAPPGQLCTRCGADLVLSRHHISSIPLDARSMGGHGGPEAHFAIGISSDPPASEVPA